MSATISLQCKKCKNEITEFEMKKSIAKHGLIYISNENQVFIGCNCPKCPSPTPVIQLFERKIVENYLNQLSFDIECSYNSKLVYHSFPYNLRNEYFGDKDKFSCITNQMVGEISSMDRDLIFPVEEEYPIKFKDRFSTYSFASPAMTPAISIWFSKKEHIENLAQIESEKKLQIFPRYIIFNPLFYRIECMCWEYRMLIDYIDSWKRDFPVTEIMMDSPKKDLSQTFDFMHILDIIHMDNIRDFTDECSQTLIVSSITSRMPKLPQTDNQRLSSKDHRMLSKTVWANFTKDYMQDLLLKLSKKFIDEYLLLSTSIDFSFDTVFSLKESYLKNLFQAVQSKEKRRTLRKKAQKDELAKAREAESHFPSVKIISHNSEINKLKIKFSKLHLFSSQKIKILLLGERGTGKGLFAEAIHEASKRSGKFILCDCGSINENIFENTLFGHDKESFTGADRNKIGAFEEAADGTIFLDEIGNIPTSLQKKLLGVVQNFKIQRVGPSKSKNIDLWIVFATNKNLKEMVNQKEFMPDLYDRISTLKFEIPPLRKRKEDIPLLVEHFMEKHDSLHREDPKKEKITIAKDCMKELSNYDWPGNVRQLESFIEGVIQNKILDEDRSPIDISDFSTFQTKSDKSARSAPERPKGLPGSQRYTDEEIKSTLAQTGGNKSQAAKILNSCYGTILRRSKKFPPS